MYFYPRPPRGGRPHTSPWNGNPLHFYPRPPRGGRRRHLRRVIVGADISIHAHRVVGDLRPPLKEYCLRDFYPRPPRGGRLFSPFFIFLAVLFLSTPSARRATCSTGHVAGNGRISIHALREEGDAGLCGTAVFFFDFYPRPPRGGRLIPSYIAEKATIFLSTPSARRATRPRASKSQQGQVFLSTPSARRATPAVPYFRVSGYISIHALREEGDFEFHGASEPPLYFYPRPPRGGRLGRRYDIQ